MTPARLDQPAGHAVTVYDQAHGAVSNYHLLCTCGWAVNYAGDYGGAQESARRHLQELDQPQLYPDTDALWDQLQGAGVGLAGDTLYAALRNLWRSAYAAGWNDARSVRRITTALGDQRVPAPRERRPAGPCAECGHLHYHGSARGYSACPLAREGCQCTGQEWALQLGPFPQVAA